MFLTLYLINQKCYTKKIINTNKIEKLNIYIADPSFKNECLEFDMKILDKIKVENIIIYERINHLFALYMLRYVINIHKPFLNIHTNSIYMELYNIDEHTINHTLSEIGYKMFGRTNNKNFYYCPGYIYQNSMIINKIIFVLWLGDNDLTENRALALKSIINNISCNIILITHRNLNKYILKDYPLHKIYKYLHITHRADYMRCYLMHHYGGGYTDIKYTENDWNSYFTNLYNEKDLCCIGYKELNEKSVSNTDDKKMLKKLKKNWFKLLGNCAYIFKPYTNFTKDWYKSLMNKLDIYYEQMKDKPTIHEQFNNNVKDEFYPIKWELLLGAIFHPLCLKYNDNIANTLQPPKSKNYR